MPLLGRILLITTLVFLALNVGVFVYLRFPKSVPVIPEPQEMSTPAPLGPSPTPTPTPYPLPQGRRSFQLNYGKAVVGPKIGTVTVDPFDPKVGEPQSYTANITHSSPIVSAELTLHTDNKIATRSMTRVSGNDTNGTWEVKFTTDDTHFYKYYAYFIVKSAVDEFRGGLTFRAY